MSRARLYYLTGCTSDVLLEARDRTAALTLDSRHLGYATILRQEGRIRMRSFWVLGAMSLVVGLSGCMIVESPIRGVVGTEVIWGDVAAGKGPTPGGMKVGKACAESILGLIARGDASVRAAKENGKITEVFSVDHSARNFFGIVGEWCTLVRGT
jgi:hypothetical protein